MQLQSDRVSRGKIWNTNLRATMHLQTMGTFAEVETQHPDVYYASGTVAGLRKERASMGSCQAEDCEQPTIVDYSEVTARSPQLNYKTTLGCRDSQAVELTPNQSDQFEERMNDPVLRCD